MALREHSCMEDRCYAKEQLLPLPPHYRVDYYGMPKRPCGDYQSHLPHMHHPLAWPEPYVSMVAAFCPGENTW